MDEFLVTGAEGQFFEVLAFLVVVDQDVLAGFEQEEAPGGVLEPLPYLFEAFAELLHLDLQVFRRFLEALTFRIFDVVGFLDEIARLIDLSLQRKNRR